MWEYDVARDHLSEFERVYGPEGEWARLFARAAGFVRTDLYRDRSAPSRFVTIDHWASEAAWQAFRTRSAESYERLDAKCASLTTREARLGVFERVGDGTA
jgi:quinol monooxygenase YgiN